MMDYESIRQDEHNIPIEDIQNKNEELQKKIMKLSVKQTKGDPVVAITPIANTNDNNVKPKNKTKTKTKKKKKTNIEIESEKKFLLGKSIDWLVREKAPQTPISCCNTVNKIINTVKPEVVQEIAIPKQDTSIKNDIDIERKGKEELGLRKTKSYSISTPTTTTRASVLSTTAHSNKHTPPLSPSSSSSSLGKKSISSSGSSNSNNNGGGFFKRLFGSHKDKKPEKETIVKTPIKRTRSQSLYKDVQPLQRAKSEVIAAPLPSLHSTSAASAASTAAANTNTKYKETTENKLHRSRTTGSINNNKDEGVDERLCEFLKFYAKKNSNITNTTVNNQIDKQTSARTYSKIKKSSTHREPPVNLDVLGRPLPNHPKKSKFKPILRNKNDVIYSKEEKSKMCQGDKSRRNLLQQNSNIPNTTLSRNSNGNRNNNNNNNNSNNSFGNNNSNFRFGSFLKKVTSNIDSEAEYDLDGMNDYYDNETHAMDNNHSRSNQGSSSSSEEDDAQFDDVYSVSSNESSNDEFNFNPSKTASGLIIPPGLEEIKPLKKVSFAKNTFFNDPPQQICSRNPRKGEVEVKTNGTVIIHRLTADQKKEIATQHTQGIVVGGSGHLKLMPSHEEDSVVSSDEEGTDTGSDTDSKNSDPDSDLDSDDEEEQEDKKKKKQEKTRSSSTPPSSESSDDSGCYLTSTDPRKREIELITAEVKAESRAKDSSQWKLRKVNTNNEVDVDVQKSAACVTIDKPMISRRSGTSISLVNNNSQTSLCANDVDAQNDNIEPVALPASSKNQSANEETHDKSEGHFIHNHNHKDYQYESANGVDEEFPPANPKITNDVLYTRCCHLREILPVPSILKQIPRGKYDTIPILQLRNPKPTMVEIQSFSDYISIAPIMCLSLDGVVLTEEMFRLILSSILKNYSINKISLKNTPIDEGGWKFLCYFLIKLPKENNLLSLDLTMVEGIHCNVQKPSRSSQTCTLQRMKCNTTDRIDRNWNLLIASIGCNSNLNLHNLFVSGCKVNHVGPETWDNFLSIACKNVERLGLAYNELSLDHIKRLTKWISNSCKAINLENAAQLENPVQSPIKSRKLTGLDLGFNDLKGKLGPFIEIMTSLELVYLSLNSTNLSCDKELPDFFNLLAFCRNLKFLDLSNNQQLFPECRRLFTESLPLYPTLLRLHLDWNKMDSESLVAIAEVVPMCKSLNYLSILGNDLDKVSCKSFLYAVRKSKSLIALDFDTDINEKIDWFAKKLSIYTLKNMEHEIKRLKNNNQILKGKGEQECTSSDTISTIQKEMGMLLTGDFESNSVEFLTRSYGLIDKIDSSRLKLHDMIDDLFKFRVNGELTTEGKETLIRLCFMDTALEKSLHLLSVKMNDPKLKINETIKDTNFSVFKKQFQNMTGDRNHGAFGNTNNPLDSQASLSLNEDVNTDVSRETSNPDSNNNQLGDATKSYKASDIVDFQGSSASLSSKFSAAVANNQTKEEGDVFRKTTKIKNATSRIPKNLIKASENMSSEDIKEFILTNDVGKVVDLISALETEGVNFHDIFKKTGCKNLKDGQCISSALLESSNQATKEKDEEDVPLPSKTDELSNSSSEDSFDDEESYKDDDDDDDELEDYNKDDDEVDKTYDHLLNTIEQNRSSSNVNV